MIKTTKPPNGATVTGNGDIAVTDWTEAIYNGERTQERTMYAWANGRWEFLTVMFEECTPTPDASQPLLATTRSEPEAGG